MRTRIDHLVIGAASLAQGVAYVNRLLAVDIPYGGEHRTMGTHNHVMKIGEDLFLEVLAINPANDPLEKPRWYGLDDPYVRQALQSQPAHPSQKMADSGCRLQSLEIFHPCPAWLQAVLESIGAADLVKIHAQHKDEPPRLAAYLDTPKGCVQLLSGTGGFGR